MSKKANRMLQRQAAMNHRRQAPAPIRMPKAAPSRTPATGEDVLAAKLNQARELLVEKQRAIIALQARVGELELVIAARDNESFREEHGLRLGRKLTRDEKTGEWWWEDAGPAAAEGAEGAEDAGGEPGGEEPADDGDAGPDEATGLDVPEEPSEPSVGTDEASLSPEDAAAV